MFHTLAFAAAALDATAGDVQLAGVSEDLFQLNSSRFRIPENYDLIFSYIGGVGLTRARINTPSMRTRGFPQLFPLNVAVAPVTRPAVGDYRHHPIKLRYDEDLEIDITNAAAADAVCLVGVTQQDMRNAPVPSDARWVRFTASVTMTVLTWSAPAVITFQESIDSGQYGVYGAGAVAADSVALRLIFNNQYMRPGFLVQPTAGLIPDAMFNKTLGLWGTFRNTVAPQIQGLGTVAGAETIEGRLLISKLTD